jgi:hypothetical protein
MIVVAFLHGDKIYQHIIMTVDKNGVKEKIYQYKVTRIGYKK